MPDFSSLAGFWSPLPVTSLWAKGCCNTGSSSHFLHLRHRNNPLTLDHSSAWTWQLLEFPWLLLLERFLLFCSLNPSFHLLPWIKFSYAASIFTGLNFPDWYWYHHPQSLWMKDLEYFFFSTAPSFPQMPQYFLSTANFSPLIYYSFLDQYPYINQALFPVIQLLKKPSN